MAKNVDAAAAVTQQEPAAEQETAKKPKTFKQMESKSFPDFEQADTYRKSVALDDSQKIRVKYRRSTRKYDVVLFKK